MLLRSKIERYDTLSYFLPTCPFVNADDIQKGFSLLKDDVDSVNCIAEYDVPIQLAMVKKGDNLIPIFDNLTSCLTNSKYIQKYYHPTGAFYMSWWDKIIAHKNFFVGNVKGYVMPKDRLVDINDKEDLQRANQIFEKYLVKS